MRLSLVLVALLLLAAVVPTAARAQVGDVRLAVEPGSVEAKPGDRIFLNLTIQNPTTRALGLTLVATPDDASMVRVTLKNASQKIPAGERVRVPVLVEILRPATLGDHPVTFTAAEAISTRAAPYSTTLDLRVVQPKPETSAAAIIAPTQPSPAIPLAVAAAAATAGLGLAGLAYAHRRWGWLGLAPLYTRLHKSRVLESPLREKLAQVVREEPGISFGDLRRKLDVGAGTLTHNARVLEDAGVIFSSPDGDKRRFFATDHGRVAPVPSLAERALAALAQRGPCSLSELSQHLGVSRQALHYHVTRLREEGRIVAQGATLAASEKGEPRGAGA